MSICCSIDEKIDILKSRVLIDGYSIGNDSSVSLFVCIEYQIRALFYCNKFLTEFYIRFECKGIH